MTQSGISLMALCIVHVRQRWSDQFLKKSLENELNTKCKEKIRRRVTMVTREA